MYCTHGKSTPDWTYILKDIPTEGTYSWRRYTHGVTYTRNDTYIEQHTYGATYTRKDIHMEGNIHDGDIHMTYEGDIQTEGTYTRKDMHMEETYTRKR